MLKTYKLIVIGAGSGGLTAAEVAAAFGARVALVEQNERLGGECLHTGCVPSKALIHTARIRWQARHGNPPILDSLPPVDFSKIKAHVDSAIHTIEAGHDSQEYYRSLGVDVVHGRARFIDKRTIQVGEDQLRADKIIISTGSRPFVPRIDGLSDGPFLTNETIFELTDLPKSLIVLGGGPIGCELGQAFAMLGTSVTILQSASRLLPRDDEEAAAALAQSLKAMGITVLTDSAVTKVTYKNETVTVLTEKGSITAAKLLVAAGRTPTIPEGVENAGVKVGERGIKVNARLQTSNSRIYAIGDCNGIIQLTHTAAEQASHAVQNALFYQRKEFTLDTVSWTTFTTPEIAHFGPSFTKESLPRGYAMYSFNYNELDRAIADGAVGFGSIVVNKKGTIVSSTIVGQNAGESLALVRTAGSIEKLATTTQSYPTYASGLWQAASSAYIARITRRPLGKILQLLSS